MIHLFCFVYFVLYNNCLIKFTSLYAKKLMYIMFNFYLVRCFLYFLHRFHKLSNECSKSNSRTNFEIINNFTSPNITVFITYFILRYAH